MILLFIVAATLNPMADKAWDCLNKKQFDKGQEYASICVEKNMRVATILQNDGVKQTYPEQMPLNTAGECLYLRGRLFEESGDLIRAKIAYEAVIEFFPDAWAGFPGTTWSPAKEAQKRIECINEKNTNGRSKEKKK